jgi:hypothetical protein
MACKGNRDGALILMSEAVDLLKRTDAVTAQAETLVDLAEVLRRSGRGKDADEILDDAVALFDAKENLAAADAIRTLARSA